MNRLNASIGLILLVASASATTFHGDVARTGVYAGPAPTTLDTTRWSFDTGGPIVASPVVDRDVVYVASLSGKLFAVDARSGQQKWQFKSRMPIASTPAVSDGSVYFVSSTGALAAVDAERGTPRWVFATEHERRFEARNLHGYPSSAQTIPDAWDVYTSSPAVAGGRVYFGSGDGGIYAVDARSGLLQWKVQTGDVVHASPAVVDNTVFVGSFDGRFYAIDATLGIVKWVFQGGVDPHVRNQQGFQSSAAVVQGVVYVGSRDAHVYALDAATGRKIWDYPTSKSWVNGTPAVRDGMVFVGTADTARLMALDARNGRLRWNFDAGAYVFSSVALAGNRAVVGSHNGKVFLLDVANGQQVSEFRTERSKLNSGQLLTAEGRINPDAFAPVFGDFQDMYIDHQRFISLGAILASPAIAEGTVYVGSTDGRLYALGPPAKS
jgi:eukaryotic-like serine/threonine-protein kinase